ncbi:hypothetical protein CEUSTIGMA_g7415.t1 [Chlamydomonas eustigma]|uniref:Uncharacterized protein n=1 Tax=Chlamydomonas eustigma TaxID=1157962 RepID=A0A250XAA7_9CHLO|nr:hypothetical protein CEUSTIGMA_g7415.t1 [Chlamydomonas eustigma]|eukprot:GAX79976.1 hypothetical protein CEUSTIGMA_g7415.t1 [Chlamydomonas eustigma]
MKTLFFPWCWLLAAPYLMCLLDVAISHTTGPSEGTSGMNATIPPGHRHDFNHSTKPWHNHSSHPMIPPGSRSAYNETTTTSRSNFTSRPPLAPKMMRHVPQNNTIHSSGRRQVLQGRPSVLTREPQNMLNSSGYLMREDHSHGPVVLAGMWNHSHHAHWSMHGNYSHGKRGGCNHSGMYKGAHGTWGMIGNHSYGDEVWPLNKSLHGEWSVDKVDMTGNLSGHQECPGE